MSEDINAKLFKSLKWGLGSHSKSTPVKMTMTTKYVTHKDASILVLICLKRLPGSK